jgi:hypothetical protein
VLPIPLQRALRALRKEYAMSRKKEGREAVKIEMTRPLAKKVSQRVRDDNTAGHYGVRSCDQTLAEINAAVEIIADHLQLFIAASNPSLKQRWHCDLTFTED